jgi:penicillin-binding protein 1A
MMNSTNTVAVKTLDDLTLDYAYSYATNEMGLSTLVDSYELGGVEYTDKSYWSLALGGMVQGVTIRDLTAAYAAVENGGTYREARTYTKVLDSEGNLVLDNTQSSHTAMSEKAAYYLTYMMQETVKNGTGKEAQIEGMSTAGKTGTTSDDKDRWFAGYTPYYTAVVWCGYDTPQEIVLEDDSIENPASVLWNKVMTKVNEGKTNVDFSKPSDIIEVEVCADSGLLPTDWCVNDLRGDRTTTVLLAAEDVPTTYCNIHVETSICVSEDGYHVANEYCAEKGTVEKYGLLNYSRQFPVADIVVTDQQYCVGVLVKQSGYSEARCDTLDPVNKVCTIHTSSRQITTSRYRDDDDDDDYDDDDYDDDDEDDDEYDPIVVLPTVQ